MSGIEVKIKDGEKVDMALKIFKRKVMRSGLLKDLRAREAYTKPSVARKEKRKAAQSRRRREERRALEEQDEF